MSQLVELADRLRAIADELPIGHVTSAAGRLRTAGGLLAWVMHTSSQPTGAPTLAVASEHLDRAAGAMLAAREAIAAYLIAIGLPRDGVPQEDRDWQAGLAPGQPVPPPRRRGDESRLASFWADRIDEVTDRVGARRGDRERAAPTSAELLHRAVAGAMDEDRAKLGKELAAVDPAVGLGLSALTPPLLRHLAADLVGHPPRAEDLKEVRKAAVARLGKLVPKLPPEIVEEQLARACRALDPEEIEKSQREDRKPEKDPAHPVDSAVAGVVLVAGLMAATRREPNELAEVIEELRKRTETEQKQAQLRRQSADEARGGRPPHGNRPPRNRWSTGDPRG